MGILQNNHHCYFINIHYGIYGIIVELYNWRTVQ